MPMTNKRIVMGDRAQEVRAIQLVALALSGAGVQIEQRALPEPRARCVRALLAAASRALALASCAGLETPLEVWALAARNSFELWLRLLHILGNDANTQRW